MVGLVLILLISLALFKLTNQKIDSLGLLPGKSRLTSFTVGFLMSAVACSIYFISLILSLDAEVSFNDHYTLLDSLSSFWWILKSVLFEELLFRGALFFFAIQILGKHKACFLSASIFGVYHWFSYEVFGDASEMLTTFIITGIGGLMFAYAFAYTKSLYLPIGLHLGWNLVTIMIFSQGPLGEQVLISSTSNYINGIASILFFLYQILFLPVLVFFYLKKYRSSYQVIVQEE